MQPIPHSLCKSQRYMSALPSLGLALVLLLSLSCACTEREKTSLLQFLSRLSKDGGLTMSWRNGTDCCTWEGITCNANREVSEVSLAARGLQGRISPSLGNLDGMLRLNLSRNAFIGGLPLELMSSSSMVSLDVSFNSLSGAIHELPSSIPDRPLQVFNISSNFFTGLFPSTTWEKTRNLVAINASNNSFTGWIPSSFCVNSPSFAVLDLCNNQFSGYIPPGIGKCSALRMLKAGQNNLSGTLPDELFDAILLEHLSLPNNGLEGRLDSEHVIKLRNLAILDLGRNNFSGKIPDAIGQLKRLGELHLDYNTMSGELPPALGSCTNLKIINLKGNNFNGQLLQLNFSTLPNLQVLDLMLNNFTGEIPESIYACSNLTALRLSSNNFNGKLSPGLGNLKSLSFLSLANNAFKNVTNALHVLKNCRNLTTLLMGTNFMDEVMPHDITADGYENLQILTLDGCPLSGELPLWVSKLTRLEILDLSNNQLTGSIPAWINSLNFLYYLDLSNNGLSGKLSTALMERPVLRLATVADHLDNRVFGRSVYIGPSFQYCLLSGVPKVLNLGNNKFTDAIPPEIGQRQDLHVLNLSSNNLFGVIPQTIGNLKILQVLDLSINHLTGAIPQALTKLHFLSEFNVSYNDLEGPIPTGGQFDAFTKSSFDGNPKLCGYIHLRPCRSAEVPPSSIISTKQTIDRTVLVIAFSAFFGVGVLYDQLVLSRYFG